MKYQNLLKNTVISTSPSVWREWIEIYQLYQMLHGLLVSLRVEGVD